MPIREAHRLGQPGQRTSGASNTYGSVLKGGFADPTSGSVHNSGWQQVYDAGLVGLAFLVAALLVAFYRWSRLLTTRGSGVAALAMVATATVTGATEVSIVPDRMDVPFVLLLILLATAVKTGDETTARAPDSVTDPTARRELVLTR